jgi:hypothetical protein
MGFNIKDIALGASGLLDVTGSTVHSTKLQPAKWHRPRRSGRVAGLTVDASNLSREARTIFKHEARRLERG